MSTENKEEPKPKNIYQKLLEVQKHVNGLAKDKKSNNYSYVTGDKVLGFIKPLMNDLGLLLKQEVTSIENERMDYKTGIGTQYEKPKSEILSKVMMRFTWIDTETGEKESEKENKNVSLINERNKTESKKEVDKKQFNPFWWYIGFAIFLIILVIAYFVLKRLKII